MRTDRMRRLAGVAFLSVISLIAAGCAGESATTGDRTSSLDAGIVNATTETTTPVSGGTLTYSGYSAVTTLDPAKAQIAGASGGTELAAIYDTLMRYDPVAKEFEPKLAQSLTANTDNTVWTLTLRDNVQFSDGQELDAQAVRLSIERYVANKAPQSSLWAAKIRSMETPDASTVTFDLAEPWTGIRSMLATGPGMVVAPSAQGEQFAPVGAGAFTVEEFAPNEELILEARADYYGGKPNVDKLRMISIIGGQPTAESLKSGSIDSAYIRNLVPAMDLVSNGYPGYVDLLSLGSVANVNTAPGRPGSDVRVRQAMALAIDPAVLDTRVNDGKGFPGQEIFQETSRWHNDVPTIGTDPTKARELLEQAKADGYDGKISYLAMQDPTAQATALGVQAMLNSVGFETSIDYVNAPSDLVKKMYADHDYDIGAASVGVSEADPYERLYTTLKTGGRNNATGYSDATTDELLDKLGVSVTDEEKRSALADISARLYETSPLLIWGANPALNVWAKNVHGVSLSLDGMMFFDQAWKS